MPDGESRRGTAFLVLRNQPASPAAEAYRGMRTSLQMLPEDKQVAVVFTSCGAGDGKTFCSVNLAVAQAAVGKRVLAVDADLRRPTLHRVFRVARGQGLSTLLSEEAVSGSAIVPTEVPGLDVLPSGPVPPNPSELLGSLALERLLDQWLLLYDRVIFDAPPVLGISDALVLARAVGRAILVARAGQTTDRQLRHATDILRGANVEILGAVLNGARARDEDAYGYAVNYWPRGYVDTAPAPRSPIEDWFADR